MLILTLRDSHINNKMMISRRRYRIKGDVQKVDTIFASG